MGCISEECSIRLIRLCLRGPGEGVNSQLNIDISVSQPAQKRKSAVIMFKEYQSACPFSVQWIDLCKYW